jgi:hypothetical protein
MTHAVFIISNDADSKAHGTAQQQRRKQDLTRYTNYPLMPAAGAQQHPTPGGIQEGYAKLSEKMQWWPMPLYYCTFQGPLNATSSCTRASLYIHLAYYM